MAWFKSDVLYRSEDDDWGVRQCFLHEQEPVQTSKIQDPGSSIVPYLQVAFY
jgi:hypothetical protein